MKIRLTQPQVEFEFELGNTIDTKATTDTIDNIDTAIRHNEKATPSHDYLQMESKWGKYKCLASLKMLYKTLVLFL